jgi:putative redox protein
MRLEIATQDGHPIAVDSGPPDGDGGAADPIDLVLAALAGCTSMDVASILRKKRQRAERYTLHLTGERATEHPRVYTHIVVEHRVEGAVTAEALRRSIELSATRYCPVSALLSKGVTIEHRYRLTRRDGTEHAALVVVTGPGAAPDA